jgi:hypothetical protein
MDVMIRVHDLTSGPSRARLRLDPDARFALRADGWIDLADLWDRAVAAALADEAHQLIDGDPAGGPHLDALHVHLAALTRSLTGQVLVPTTASYMDAASLASDWPDASDLVLVAAVGSEDGYPRAGVRAFRGDAGRAAAKPVPGPLAVLRYGPAT